LGPEGRFTYRDRVGEKATSAHRRCGFIRKWRDLSTGSKTSLPNLIHQQGAAAAKGSFDLPGKDLFLACERLARIATFKRLKADGSVRYRDVRPSRFVTRVFDVRNVLGVRQLCTDQQVIHTNFLSQMAIAGQQDKPLGAVFPHHFGHAYLARHLRIHHSLQGGLGQGMAVTYFNGLLCNRFAQKLSVMV